MIPHTQHDHVARAEILGFARSVSSVVFGYIVELFGFGWGFTFIARVKLV